MARRDSFSFAEYTILPEKWSLDGIVCWHPVIVIQWFAFCGLIELVDDGLRRGYGAFRANASASPLTTRSSDT